MGRTLPWAAPCRLVCAEHASSDVATTLRVAYNEERKVRVCVFVCACVSVCVCVCVRV